MFGKRRAKPRPERLPRDQRRQRCQRVVMLVQTLIAPAQIKKAKLPHRFASRQSRRGKLNPIRPEPGKRFFEVP